MAEKAKKPTNKKEPATKKAQVKKSFPQYGMIMLVDSVFQNNQDEPKANFVGIPLNKECPFVEFVFDPYTNMLAIVSKVPKKQFQFVPKLDSNGFPKPNSNKKLQKDFPQAQERILIDSYHEYYIRDAKEIEAFLNMYAVNPEFKWRKYINLEPGRK